MITRPSRGLAYLSSLAFLALFTVTPVVAGATDSGTLVVAADAGGVPLTHGLVATGCAVVGAVLRRFGRAT